MAPKGWGKKGRWNMSQLLRCFWLISSLFWCNDLFSANILCYYMMICLLYARKLRIHWRSINFGVLKLISHLARAEGPPQWRVSSLKLWGAKPQNCCVMPCVDAHGTCIWRPSFSHGHGKSDTKWIKSDSTLLARCRFCVELETFEMMWHV